MFDPYRKWLGIPDGPRPPTHYQLLGIAPGEHDREVINAAVVRQSAFVRNFQTGQYSAEATQLLNEIAAAKLCLLDPVKRAQYDVQLSPTPSGADAPQPPGTQRPPPSVGASLNLEPRASLASGQVGGARPRAPSRPQYKTSSAAASLPRSPALPARSAPLLTVPEGVWTTHDPASLRVPAPWQPARVKPPLWVWLLPFGACGVVVFAVALAAILLRKPADEGYPFVAEAGQENANATGGAETAAANTSLSPAALPASPSPIVSRPQTGPEVVPSLTETEDETDPFTTQRSTDFTNGEARVTVDDSGPGRTSHSATGPGATGAGEPSLYASEDWSDGSSLAIPAPRESPIVFARASGPYVAVGGQVYRLADGELVGHIGSTSDNDFNVLRRLSADGKRYAIGNRDMVDVLSCADGRSITQLQGKSFSVRLDFLDFGGPDQIVTATRNRGNQYVQTWNLSSGKLLKDFTVDNIDRSATLSDNGRFLAVLVNQYGVVIYDLQRSPSKGKGKISAKIPIPPVQGRLLDVDGLRFSPDGEELAAVCDNGTRLLCWSKSVELVFEHTMGTEMRSFWTGAMAYQGPRVEWHPAGRGWLLNGHTFLDRKSRRVIWLLQTDHDSNSRHRFIDEDRLAVCRGSGDRRELADIKIPWARIDRSLAALSLEDTPVWFGPNQPVSVRVELGATATATPDQVKADITQLVAQRLAEEKIRVSENQPVVLTATYSEEHRAPKTLAPPNIPTLRIRIPVRQIPGSTTATLTLRLQRQDSTNDLWSTQLVASANEDAPASSPRTALNAALSRSLRATLLPYLPKEKDLAGLPVVIRP